MASDDQPCGTVIGFSYLEPKRHISYITELDGREAQTLGPTLARATCTLKEVTAAKLVYVNVFGERVAHLHFNLAPHREGDALRGGPGLLAENAVTPPRAELALAAERIREAMRR